MSGKTKDDILASCARQMWLEAAWRDHTFTIAHKPGVDIELADALSRYHTETSKKLFADSEVKKRGLSRVDPILSNYVFFDNQL